MSIAAAIAVCSGALLFWIFAGYPLALYCIARTAGKLKDDVSGEFPGISLIVPTYNEGTVIERKIANIETLDYPKDKLEVIVVDSASLDDTVAKASRIPWVRVIQEPKKMGKAHALNTAMPQLRFGIAVVTDANATMKPDVLRKIAACFSDPNVGGATGAMRQVDSSGNAVSEGGGAYWKLETFMRKREAALHSVIAMSGEVSAFRTSLFLDDAHAVLPWYRRGATDDFEMTLWIIRRGFRVAYASDAEVWEHAPDTTRDLFSQKVRIIVQTIVSVFRNIDLVFKTGAFGAFILFSRKFLPLFAPLALIALFISSAYLAFSIVWWLVVFSAQVLGYLLALSALSVMKRNPIAKLALFFCLLNTTVAVAWIDLFRGRDYTSWQPIASSRK